MNVRFRKTKATHGSDYSWKVDVAHSYRDGAGKSRAKIIKYIGSYKVRDWNYKEQGYCEAQKLWEKADKAFAKLNLAPDEEAKLRRTLEKRIPHPPPIPPSAAKQPTANWCNPETWPHLFWSAPRGYKPKP